MKQQADTDKEWERGLALIFSVAAGLAVGNLYWAQPLLAAIAADFEVPASQGSFLITATQIGYASGILLLVPLGDIVERKRLLTAVMGLTVLALFLSVLAPSFDVLSIALFCVGALTVSGQVILPLVGDLSEPDEHQKCRQGRPSVGKTRTEGVRGQSQMTAAWQRSFLMLLKQTA